MIGYSITAQPPMLLPNRFFSHFLLIAFSFLQQKFSTPLNSYFTTLLRLKWLLIYVRYYMVNRLFG